MRCTRFYKDDKMHVQDLATGKEYPVHTYKQSAKNRWHITFFTSFNEKWWGMTGRVGNFTAKKYVNYHPVAGGSGRHNVAYRRNKAMKG